MSREFPESDWKKFRVLKAIALERFSEETLRQVAAISSDITRKAHERYLAIYELIHQRDEDLAAAFNGMSRSRAFFKLAAIASYGLLTDEELATFSPETREVIKLLADG